MFYVFILGLINFCFSFLVGFILQNRVSDRWSGASKDVRPNCSSSRIYDVVLFPHNLLDFTLFKTFVAGNFVDE